MKAKNRKLMYLLGGLLSVSTFTFLSINGANAHEEETVSVNTVLTQDNQADNSSALSVGQITTGQVVTTGQSSAGTASGSNVSYGTSTNVESSPIAETWVPQTPEEKLLYSYVGTDKPAVSVGGASGVRASNSVQGPLCHEVFQSVLGDYTLARTYNIFPGASNLSQPVYETDKPVVLTMEIPKSLQKEGRTFELICVSNGVPYVFEDLGTSSDSITIQTKYFYAYALCYKDQQ